MKSSLLTSMLLLFSATIFCQQLEYSMVVTLDKDFAGCGITASDQVTSKCVMVRLHYIVITCLTQSYIYASADFGQISVKRQLINGEVRMARRVLLSNGKTGVAYILNTNKVYQASLSFNTIVNALVYTIPFDANDVFAPQIFDIQHSPTAVLIYYENSTLISYSRMIQNSQDQQLPLLRSTQLNLPANDQKIFSMFNTTLFYSYVSPNKSINVYAGEGLKFQYSIKLQFQPSALSSSAQYLIIGCADCNAGRGQFEVYRGSLKVGEGSGDTDNMKLGTDIVAMSDTQFHIGSNSNELMNKRQFYSNIIRVAQNQSGQVEIELIKQAVKGVVNTPHGGLIVEKNNDGMLFKFSFHKGIYLASLCPSTKFYQSQNRTCAACPASSFSLSLQSKFCQTCTTQITNLTAFQKLLQITTCQSFLNPGVLANVTVTPLASKNTSINQSAVSPVNSSNVVTNATNIINNQTSTTTSTNQTSSTESISISSNSTFNYSNSSPSGIKNSSNASATTNSSTNSGSGGIANRTNSTSNVTTQTVGNQTQTSNNAMNATSQIIPKTNITTSINSNSETHKTTNYTNITSNSSVPQPQIVYGNNQTAQPNATTSQSESISNITQPLSPVQSTNKTLSTPEGDNSDGFNKAMIGIGIAVAFLVLGTIAGVLRWLHVKRQQKFKMLKNQFKQEATINVGMPTSYEITNIGHTVEDLRPRHLQEIVALDTQHSKSNSNMPIVEPKLNNDFEVVHPVETTFNQKDFDSAQIQREVEKEVEHLRNLFMHGEQQETTPNNDDFHDLESRPATSDEQLWKAQVIPSSSQQVSRFSLGENFRPIQKQKKRKDRFFAELEQSVTGLQINAKNYKLSKTDKKGKTLDFIKENQTPNTFHDFKPDNSNLSSERTNMPGESRRNLIKKK